VIEIGRLGVIERGDDAGFQIKVLDDSDNSGGFLIITGKNLNDRSSEAFDGWVATKEELQGYFEESKWVVKWL
jgi:hypothetical protein